MTPWLGLMAVAGCGTGEGTSYVLLDESARAARVEVEAGGRFHGGAMPLEVEAGTQVDVVTLFGRHPLRVATGRVYQVQGSAGNVFQSALGLDVRGDLVEVGAPEPVARNLASALGAQAEPWNGRWRLQGPDVLARLSWMGDVADVSPVVPVLTEAAREQARAQWVERATGTRLPPPAAGPADALRAALVGLYLSDAPAGELPAQLFLDAEGGFSLEKGCDPAPVHGTYQQRDGRIELLGTNLALTIGSSGRLEGPGLVFSAGDDK